MRKLMVSILVLGILLVILDRVAVVGVQREIARQIEAKYKLEATPTVTIEGIPFLTQALAGRYEEISIQIGGITQHGVKLSGIDATLNGVNAPLMDLIQNAAAVDLRAERVTATIVISRETLDARAPRGIKVEGTGDALRVSGNLNVLGQQVPVTADLKVEVNRGAVRLTPTNVKLAGGVPVPNANRLMTFTVPIGELPFNLRITSVRTTPEGLAVQGSATDVPLRS
ncbi:LmeA family phospholipid-binding protein [Acrocarpospora catenulata]|uniref:LmeA family phospholipid-binding protein n=1 Tax=Acrocarpospora catenulata TaxID=2836182 RepID=UPI001BDB5F0B|nr:DUF2993 domain-containing protein [Acrocarpospora catenulata]